MDFAFALVNSVVLVKMTLRLVLVLALHPAFVLKKKKRAKITRGPVGRNAFGYFSRKPGGE